MVHHAPTVLQEKTDANEFTSNVKDEDERGWEAEVLHENPCGQGLLAVDPAGQKLPELQATQEETVVPLFPL
jgi:hypothetical protein